MNNTGSNDETISGTRSGAIIYEPDGKTPANGAIVKVFAIDDTARAIVAQSTTDSAGRYSFKDIGKGTYNILAKKGAIYAYQDSVYISPDTNYAKSDTLGIPGSVTAIVGLQPHHDPSTVTVQVLGTDIYANVDADGWFTLAPLARGIYNLRLVTTVPEYTPTFISISAENETNDTLRDTLWLKYTGIPLITSLSATCDTFNGAIHLSWKKTAYRDFMDYLIFRDPYSAIEFSTTPIAACRDTFFIDTIFCHRLSSGYKSFSDTNDYRFKYRVCIRSNANKIGETYKFTDVFAASPTKVRTTFNFTIYHIAKEMKTDSASINDTLLYAVNLHNPTRNLKRVVWRDLHSGKIICDRNLDTTKKDAFDTVSYAWSTQGMKAMECKVEDVAGNNWWDTCFASIVRDAPKVTITTTTPAVLVSDTIRLQFSGSDWFGEIVKWEVDPGNTGKFVEISGRDTFIIAPASPTSSYICVARATDDDGNTMSDSRIIQVTMFSLATKAVVFNNKMWIIGGFNGNCRNDVWCSSDGKTWESISDTCPFTPRYGHSSVVFDNKIWVIGGYDKFSDCKNDVWYSADGITWNEAKANADFEGRYRHSTVVFNGKMWVIGGLMINDHTPTELRDIWYSTDGITWGRAEQNSSFPALYNHACVVFGEQIWIIGGVGRDHNANENVWYSSNGYTWSQVSTKTTFFTPRSDHTCLVFDNKLWILGGWDGNTCLGDIWYSTNGGDWYQLSNGFIPRSGHTSLIFDNKIWIIAGKICGQGYKSEVLFSNGINIK
jgi:hypothetical protein